MLKITIPAHKGYDMYDEIRNEFITVKGLERPCELQLEHSLLSISKWESKWHKPFLSQKEKTTEEILDYIQTMTLTKNVDPNVYKFLTTENIDDIHDYIGDSMTATTFSNANQKNNREIITSELIYYWMVSLNIPFECEKWHLNRLLTLIRVCSIKNQPDKKMSKKDVMRNNAAINAARRKAHHSTG